MQFSVLALLVAAASAFSPAAAVNAAAVRAPVVQMNTRYGDPFVKSTYKKKDPKTGSTLGLKGYTVGSRAPPRAKNSGTVAQFGYGIDNLYGGGGNAKAAAKAGGKSAAIDEKNLKGLAPLLSLLSVVIVVGAALKN